MLDKFGVCWYQHVWGKAQRRCVFLTKPTDLAVSVFKLHLLLLKKTDLYYIHMRSFIPKLCLPSCFPPKSEFSVSAIYIASNEVWSRQSTCDNKGHGHQKPPLECFISSMILYVYLLIYIYNFIYSLVLVWKKGSDTLKVLKIVCFSHFFVRSYFCHSLLWAHPNANFPKTSPAEATMVENPSTGSLF